MNYSKYKKVFVRANGGEQVEAAINYLESQGCTGGWYDRENVPSISAEIVSDWKGDVSWAANIDHLLNDGFKEIFMPTKHKHYDFIMQWASDPSQKVWWKNPSATKWNIFVGTPCWDADYIYHIGEHPPKRKIMIGDVEIDAPEVSELAHNTEYYLPNIGAPEMYSESRWHRDDIDAFRLKTGVIHLNKEAAIAHAKALIKVSGGCVDE